MLFGSMREANSESEIELQDISFNVFNILLEYAYCGRINLGQVSFQVCSNFQYNKRLYINFHMK